MNKLKILLAMVLFTLTGCNTDLDRSTTLTFVGDSIIARWDLQNYLSSLITYNDGRSGAGIDYIEALAGKMKGKNIVVMIGTNNSNMMKDPANREAYVERYLSAISGMGADVVYLYEVLPRKFTGDDEDINSYIREFNNEVALRLTEHGNFRYMKVFDKFADDGHDIVYQYYNDGLHLSPEGYEVLSNELFNKL